MGFDLLPLHPRDRDAVVRLFARYPFKAWQKRVQGLDSDRLAGLLWDLLEPHVGRTQTTAVLAWRRQPREAVGLAVAAPHPWHSEVFGRSMGRILHFVNYVEPAAVGPLLLEAVLAAAREAGLEQLAARLDGQDWADVQLFESLGFRCVDCSLKLTRSLEAVGRAAKPQRSEPVDVRPFEPGDLEAVQRIAARSHTHNHFYNDPRLGRQQAARLFQLWLDRCAGGLAEFLLVAETADGRIAGFVTVLSNRTLARVVGVPVGIIDYIVVDRDLAGRSIGRALLGAALERLAARHRWAELRTSHDNYSALAFYQAAGFRVVASDFVLHRWESPA